MLLGQDEISEASVVSNAYSVEYGRQAGAQVNYVTKSGTNAWHADLLFNFNNHLMNANDFFNNANGVPRPYAVSRQWGADIGGPVLEDKLFSIPIAKASTTPFRALAWSRFLRHNSRPIL